MVRAHRCRWALRLGTRTGRVNLPAHRRAVVKPIAVVNALEAVRTACWRATGLPVPPPARRAVPVWGARSGGGCAPRVAVRVVGHRNRDLVGMAGRWSVDRA